MDMDFKSLFWGMTLHPEKRYAQVATESFHVSKAALEPSVQKGGDSKGLTSVYLETGGEDYLLCSLNSRHFNESLDLNFNKGEEICLRAEGGGVVHLTGYLTEEPDFEMYDEEESDEEEFEVVQPKAKKLTPLDKLLLDKKAKENNAKSPTKKDILKAEEMKKKLINQKSPSDSDEDDTDDDDDDDDDDEDEEEEEDSDDNTLDNEAEEDDDDEDDEDDDDSESEEESPKNVKQQALATKKGAETPKDKGGNVAKEIATSPKKSEESLKAKDESAKKTKAELTATPKSAKKMENGTPSKDELSKSAKKKKEENTNGTPAVKLGEKKANGEATPAKTPKRTLKGGLIVEDLKVGNGPEAKRGKHVGVHYVGRLKSNNKQFDSSKDSGKVFKFRLGGGEVIKAWDLGVEGMKVGGKRRLIAPPTLAYGAKGCPPDIPPNSTLVFEVDCHFVS